MIHDLPSLDPRAAAVVEENAAAVGHGDSLAALVVSTDAIAAGAVRLACSPAVDVPVLKSFRFAPLWPADAGYRLAREIADLAHRHLASVDDACVVCDHGSGPAAQGELNAWTWSRPPRHFVVPTATGPEVLYFATAADRDSVDSLEEMIQSSVCGPFGWIVLARCPALGHAAFDPREVIAAVAANVTAVIVPALDGQGAVIWSPRG